MKKIIPPSHFTCACILQTPRWGFHWLDATSPLSGEAGISLYDSTMVDKSWATLRYVLTEDSNHLNVDTFGISLLDCNFAYVCGFAVLPSSNRTWRGNWKQICLFLLIVLVLTTRGWKSHGKTWKLAGIIHCGGWIGWTGLSQVTGLIYLIFLG